VTNVTKDTQSVNVLPFVQPKVMQLPVASVVAIVGDEAGAGGAEITVSSTATAMFVVLTTTEHGRFSDNAMLIEAGAPRQIVFVSWGALNITALKRSLRVEHLAENLAYAVQ
jgi:hypothetical protein